MLEDSVKLTELFKVSIGLYLDYIFNLVDNLLTRVSSSSLLLASSLLVLLLPSVMLTADKKEEVFKVCIASDIIYTIVY
jgi:hypothetical protein